jgi:predicted metal-dependent hydrolase
MPQPVLVVIGTPEWLEVVNNIGTITVIQYHTPVNYVARLVDDHAALILVDKQLPDWRFWTTTPGTSPATRRIPVFLIQDSGGDDGLVAGAALVLTPTELRAQLPQLLHNYARVPSPEQTKQLEYECEQELPELARQGIEKFNQREFYQQHDLLEALWVQTESPVRDLYRAILQVGIAYYQILRGNYRGAHKMLLRSVQWLALLPDECQGVNVAQLKADSRRVRIELERLGENRMDEFDQSLLKPVQRLR